MKRKFRLTQEVVVRIVDLDNKVHTAVAAPNVEQAKSAAVFKIKQLVAREETQPPECPRTKQKCCGGYIQNKKGKIKLCRAKECREWASAASSIGLRVPIEIEAQEDLGDIPL